LPVSGCGRMGSSFAHLALEFGLFTDHLCERISLPKRLQVGILGLPRQQGARVPLARSLDAAKPDRARAPPHLHVHHVAPVSEHLAIKWRPGTSAGVRSRSTARCCSRRRRRRRCWTARLSSLPLIASSSAPMTAPACFSLASRMLLLVSSSSLIWLLQGAVIYSTEKRLFSRHSLPGPRRPARPALLQQHA